MPSQKRTGGGGDRSGTPYKCSYHVWSGKAPGGSETAKSEPLVGKSTGGRKTEKRGDVLHGGGPKNKSTGLSLDRREAARTAVGQKPQF